MRQGRAEVLVGAGRSAGVQGRAVESTVSNTPICPYASNFYKQRGDIDDWGAVTP